jgi:hypothetical protein
MLFKIMDWHLLRSCMALFDLLINLDQSLYKSIDPQKVSTFNFLKYITVKPSWFSRANIFVYKTKNNFIAFFPFGIIFWCFFKMKINTSRGVLWPCRHFDQSWSWSMWLNWPSRGVHLQFKRCSIWTSMGL